MPRMARRREFSVLSLSPSSSNEDDSPGRYFWINQLDVDEDEREWITIEDNQEPIIIEDDDERSQLPRTYARIPKIDGVKVIELPSKFHLNVTLRPGMVVEVPTVRDDRREVDFLEIKHIVKDTKNDKVYLRGIRYVRNSLLPVPCHRLNEVTMYRREFEDDDRPLDEQGMDEVPLVGEMRPRKLIKTRDAYPEHNPAEIERTERSRHYVKRHGRLVCRFQYIQIHAKSPKTRFGKTTKAIGFRAHRLLEEQCDPGYVDGISLNHPTLREPGRPIYYMSGCCGAGGDMEGARRAGAIIVNSWDRDRDAVRTCRLNFPDVDVQRADADSIITAEKRGSIPDWCTIYHISWPCVFFSPAKTIAADHDEEMSVLLFGTREHLKKFRPIIHTQEQTSGLLTHHPEFFYTLFSDILEAGYNVYVKIHNLEDFGLPAMRKRLIIVASRVDVPLPTFPKPTHGPGTSKRHQSIWDAIGDLPHNLDTNFDDVDDWLYDPRNTMAGCVTTRGGTGIKARHWTDRPWKAIEIQRLQGFPNTFRFPAYTTSTIRKKQIGNAVPPKVWEVFIRHFKRKVELWQDGIIDMAGNLVPGRELPPEEHATVDLTEEGDTAMIDLDDDVSTPESSGSGSSSEGTLQQTFIDLDDYIGPESSGSERTLQQTFIDLSLDNDGPFTWVDLSDSESKSDSESFVDLTGELDGCGTQDDPMCLD